MPIYRLKISIQNKNIAIISIRLCVSICISSHGVGEGTEVTERSGLASRGWPAELHRYIGNREVGNVMVVVVGDGEGRRRGGGEGVEVCVALGV